MRNTRVWERACGLTRTVVEAVDFDSDAEAAVVHVRPNAKARGRCGRCGRRSPGYDQGEGRRRWRSGILLYSGVVTNRIIENNAADRTTAGK